MNPTKENPGLAAGVSETGKSKESGTTLPQTVPANIGPQNTEQNGFGASPGDWQNCVDLGLTPDLLPAVSDPTAKKSPDSKLESLGKTPSKFDSKGEVTGIHKWTKRITTAAEVAKWSKDDRLGICLQTRNVRALDCDVNTFDDAVDIEAFIVDHLGFTLPIRRRQNSSKFLMLFRLPGDLTKRRFPARDPGDFVELLATGQQAIIYGTHTSGARYEWDGSTIGAIPELTSEQFESLWAALHARFGSEPSVTLRQGQAPTVKRRLEDANDPVGVFLESHWDVYDINDDGRIDLCCPWAEGHTGGLSEGSSSSWYQAGTGGFRTGHFKCQHTSCAGRTDMDFLTAIGYLAEGFEVIEVPPAAAPLALSTSSNGRPSVDLDALFSELILTDEDVSAMADAEFLIDNLIVRGSLHAFVAPANGGKTTLFIHLCEELSARGLRIFYVNADANPSDLKRHQAHAKAHGYFVLAPDAKAGKGPQDIVNKLRALNDVGGDLFDFVVILDTLKKFANMIDKSRMRAFLALMRGLSAKGATIILLAHTNKRTEDDGKHIFEGTGDLRNDVDNMIYLESSKDEANKRQEITTRPDKVRATFEPISYVIDFNDNRKVSRCGHVLKVISNEERAVQKVAIEALQTGNRLTQRALVDYIRGVLPKPPGSKTVIDCLRKLATGDNRVFDSVKGENNSWLYSLNVRSPSAVDEFDDLTDHGSS